MRFVIITCLFALPLFHAACGGSNNTAPDNDPFATYQDCFDEHHGDEMFPVQQTIEICCIDHPIGDQPMNVVCGATAADCETYVGANLDPADATVDDISTACTKYVTDRAG